MMFTEKKTKKDSLQLQTVLDFLCFQKHKVSEIETTWLAQTLHHVQVIPEPEKKGEIFSGNKAILLLKILS